MIELLATQIVNLTCDELQDLAKALVKQEPTMATILATELDMVLSKQ